MPQSDIEAIRSRYEAAHRGDTRFYEDLAEPFEEVTYEPREFTSQQDARTA